MKKNRKFAIGLAVGAVAGMLFAPKKGSELRKDLKDLSEELISKAQDIDVKEAFIKKAEELKKELATLDKEKVISISKEQFQNLKVKSTELSEYAKNEGIPKLKEIADKISVKVQKLAKEVKEK
ncbi:MAG: YtxH domain-containing protein [Bacilli bacterium]